jgi:hypothetical protein
MIDEREEKEMTETKREEKEMTETMRTADNQIIEVGEKAYDFYADKLDDTAVVVFSRQHGVQREMAHPVTGDMIPRQVWGIWTHEDGTGMVLRDGGRVCSMAHARTMGWLSISAYDAHLVSLEGK